MLTLVIGGAASGKSEFAEAHVLTLPGQRVYLATMEPFDREGLERIRRHRQMRKTKGFETVECFVDLTTAPLLPEANVLLECMTNLMANERYSPGGGGLASVLRGIDHLSQGCRHLTIVSGDLFSGGRDYLGDTEAYLRDLALVNRYIAKRADLVVEVTAGLPHVWKGGLSW